MKNLKLILSLAAALFIGVEAKAQQGVDIQTPINGGTNNISATTTNTAAGNTFAVTKSSVLTLQLYGKLTSTGSSAVTVFLDSSSDNSTWVTNTHVVTFTANGTTVASGITNCTIGALPFFRVGERRNPNANAVTNLTLKVVSKPGI